MKTKLLTVREGLIIMDEEAEIKIADLLYVQSVGLVNASGELLRKSSYKDECKGKIIASSFIDGLPKISQSIEEIRQMIKDKEIEDLAKLEFPNENNDSYQMRRGYKTALKSNKNEFIREQMIEAINKAFENGWNHAKNFDKQINQSTYEILQSLEPKVDCYVEVKQISDDEKNLPYIQPIKYSITKIL